MRVGSSWRRTGYGGPEYSGRGSLQVVTRLLALRSNHWLATIAVPWPCIARLRHWGT